MQWKNLEEQPVEWLDLTDVDELKKRTAKEIKSEAKIAKKLIALSQKSSQQHNYPVIRNDLVLNKMLSTIQSNQFESIRGLISLSNGSNEQPKVFHFLSGKVISDSFVKDIKDCHWNDVLFLRNSKQPADTFHQLKSAIIIIFGIFIEHIIGDKFHNGLNLAMALKLVTKEMSRNSNSNQEVEIDIIRGLMKLVDKFDEYSQSSDEVRFEELLVQLDIIKASLKIKDAKQKEKFEEQYQPKTAALYRIRFILELLQAIIDEFIDLGILDKYKISSAPENKNIPVATNHLLLNEKKLLSRLNGEERNRRANQGRTQITQRIKQKIKEFLGSLSSQKYKSINEAAENLSQLRTNEINKIIQEDQAYYQHNFQYDKDRYFELIRDILRADEALESKYIHKQMKNNK